MSKITAAVAEKETEAARNRRWPAWIRLIGKGDIDALGALYDESCTIVFGLVLQILPDRKLAEDILVDIYDHVRGQARKFDSRKQTAFDWLIALSRNFAVEHLGRSSRPPSLISIGDPFQNKRHLSNAALAQLPEDQRYILEMTSGNDLLGRSHRR